MRWRCARVVSQSLPRMLRSAGFIDRHASAIVVVFAATAAGVGVAFGTYVAAASDPSGYLSQARLIAQGDLVVSVPLASRVDWPYPESSFAPLGYRPGLHAAEIVPTYPPGLPLAMALASLVGGENGPFLVGPLLAAVTVFGTYWLAARLHSRTAGVIAAALMASSPLLLSQVVQHMSDIPATALWTLALLAALAGRPISGGAVSGLAGPVRPSLLPVAGAVAIVLAIWSNRRSANRRATVSRSCSSPRPWLQALRSSRRSSGRSTAIRVASGHGTFSEMFAAANVLPNIRDYARRVLTGETPALALISAVRGAVWRSCRARQGRRSHDRRKSPRSWRCPCWRVTSPTASSPTGRTCDSSSRSGRPRLQPRARLSSTPACGCRRGSLASPRSIALTAVCARNVMTASHEGSFTLWIDAFAIRHRRPVSRYGAREGHGDRHVATQRQRELLHRPHHSSMGLRARRT